MGLTIGRVWQIVFPIGPMRDQGKLLRWTMIPIDRGFQDACAVRKQEVSVPVSATDTCRCSLLHDCYHPTAQATQAAAQLSARVQSGGRKRRGRVGKRGSPCLRQGEACMHRLRRHADAAKRGEADRRPQRKGPREPSGQARLPRTGGAGRRYARQL